MPQLQSVLIAMIVEVADFPTASFESVVSICADKTGGRILFNVRSDSHANIQRVAAIADQSSEGVTLLLLDHIGESIRIHEVPVESIPLVEAIARWADQPLHAQATTSVSFEVMSLLEVILLSRST